MQSVGSTKHTSAPVKGALTAPRTSCRVCLGSREVCPGRGFRNSSFLDTFCWEQQRVSRKEASVSRKRMGSTDHTSAPVKGALTGGRCSVQCVVCSV